jgi:hypothetical protein
MNGAENVRQIYIGRNTGMSGEGGSKRPALMSASNPFLDYRGGLSSVALLSGDQRTNGNSILERRQ